MSDKELIESGLAKVSAQLESAIEKQNKELEGNASSTRQTREEVKALAEQHAELSSELKSINDSLTAIEQKGVSLSGNGDKPQSIGDIVVESSALASYKEGRDSRFALDIDNKTFLNNTITTGGDNSVTRHFQLPGVVPGAVRQLTVMPTVMQGQTDSNIIYYSRETNWVNAAAETGEGLVKPESTLEFEEVNVPVRTIPHFLKVSKQAMDDSTFLSSFIDMRMSHGVRNRIEQQIIAGDGTGVNLSGWLAAGNNTAVSGAGTLDIFGFTNTMKQAVIAADYIPDYFYFNPADWSAVETIRRGAGDAAFVGGDGGVLYYPGNGLPPMLWGIPVIQSNNVPAGTIICKSTDADMYFNRNDVRVEIFEQDTDNVQKNLLTVRAEARGAEAVMVPAAIASGLISSITA